MNDDDLLTVDAELVPAGVDEDLAALERWRRPQARSYSGGDRPLSAGAQRLVSAGIPASTRDTYNRAWGHYWDYGVERFGFDRVEAELLPSRESTMIEYLHRLEGLPVHNRCAGGRQADGEPCLGHRPAPPSVWIWYSAVRLAHSIADPPWPWHGGKRLALAMKTYCEEMPLKLGWQPNAAPRAWPEHVMAMVDALDLEDLAHLRDRAQVLVGWYTGGRASDLATYRIADIEFVPDGAVLTLRGSKTNQAVGRVVERRYLRFATNPRYCAVRALTAWIAALRALGITQGALFRPFTKPSPTGKRVLLRGARDGLGYRMSSVSISDIVGQAAVRAGVPGGEHFTQHSFRRGRASHLRALGVDELGIARALGWKGRPPATYMEEAAAFDPAAPAAIGLLG